MNENEIAAVAEKHLDRWFAECPHASTRTLRSFPEEAITEALKINDENWRKGRETVAHQNRNADKL